jgi:hypothetical protein
MFEIGHDQAMGLRSASLANSAVRVMPVAAPAVPARGYELLCALASHLTSLGHPVVIVDGTASETPGRRSNDGSHLGLLHALQDPSIAGLEHAGDRTEWLVLPGMLGLQALQQTSRLAGPTVALSRLCAPFAPDTFVLLFAPAQILSPLLSGLTARTLVPVLNQPQATLDAYGAVKLLHGGGLQPVLAPMEADPSASSQIPLQKAVDSVVDCARRHLGAALDAWPTETWGQRVQECALSPEERRPGGVQPPYGMGTGSSTRFEGMGAPMPTPTLWS